MQYLVKCKNCGLKWTRVMMIEGGDTVAINELMDNCPNCKSNWYEVIEEEADNGK